MKIIKDFQQKSKCFYNETSTLNVLRILLTDGSSAVVLYRIAQFFRKIGLSIISAIILDINKFINGCVIGRHAEFDEGFVLMHPIGVVINGGVKGGKNIVIESSVVIGAARNGMPVEVPKLGDNVFIGTGAKILGGITIGDNVQVGANAVVVKDVRDNSTVVGIPARAVHVKEDNV